MAYEIAIYQSDNLRSYCYSEYGNEWEVQDRVETYLKGINDRLGQTHFTVKTPSSSVPAPTEPYSKSFTTEDPCSGYPVSYDGLLSWWQDYLDCQISRAGADSNILVTNIPDQPNGGQAVVDGREAVAQTGNQIPDLPSYYTGSGTSDAHSALDTVLHEIFHNLTDGGIYEQFENHPDPAHDLGDTFYNLSGEWFHSPLAVDSDGDSENLCGDTINHAPGQVEHTFGACTRTHSK